MRVTHVVENLDRGGLERMVIDLALLQRAQGYDCKVLCLFGRGSMAPELESQGIEVVACNKATGPDLQAVMRARRALRKRGGVLHTHNAAAHYHAVLAAAGLGFSRVVNTRHGMGGFNPGSRRERLYRASMRGTHAVVAVCDAARKRLQESGVRPKDALLSIPNGIPIDRFSPGDRAARGMLLAEFDLDPSARILGTVGRLHPAKDQAGMLKAFRHVREAVPEAVLLLVGDGALRGPLEAVAREEGVASHVRFLGDRGDVARLARGFELFLLSSLTEGWSIALMEACATGLPIVATTVGGNPEIVEHGVNGLLVPPAEPEALADAVVSLLNDPGRVARMGEAARRWVLETGSLAAMARRYDEVYAGVGQ